uniref:Uncharacterized protein n=1 Tax=Rhizophora mucronata TaxID=61149 RepID=A0A2P2Q0S3_RHIMU
MQPKHGKRKKITESNSTFRIQYGQSRMRNKPLESTGGIFDFLFKRLLV